MQDTALSQASSPDAITGAAAKADYVIDLAAIRVSSGILWDRMQDGIAARLKSALSRVAPSATFRQAGPDMTRCVVSMPPPDERAAKACTLAAYELVAGLMGRCELSDLHISRTLIDPVRGPCQERLTIEEITHYLDQGKAPPSTGVLPRPSPRKSAPPKEPVTDPARQRSLSAEFGFEPVWDAKAQAVSMYLCTAHQIWEESDTRTAVARSTLSPRERASIEFEGALTGIEQLIKHVDRGDRFMLNLPVGFETLASPVFRTELTQICRGVLPVYRPYLVFSLTDIPAGVSATRLSDFVMLLRPFGRVGAVAATGERNHFAYQNIGLCGIAADLVRHNENRRKSDILTLAATARNFKLGATLYNVDDASLIAFAHAADVRLFHGPAIGKPLPEPRRMTHLPLANILPAAKNAGEEEWF